jgi:hypothetical protein
VIMATIDCGGSGGGPVRLQKSFRILGRKAVDLVKTLRALSIVASKVLVDAATAKDAGLPLRARGIARRWDREGIGETAKPAKSRSVEPWPRHIFTDGGMPASSSSNLCRKASGRIIARPAAPPRSSATSLANLELRVRNRSRQRSRSEVDGCRFWINTVAPRAVAEPKNTDDRQTWPSSFVEKGYQRVTLPNDQATLSQRRLTISFRPLGSADPTGTCCCVTATALGGRSRTSLPVRLSLAYRHFLAKDVNRREV